MLSQKSEAPKGLLAPGMECLFERPVCHHCVIIARTLESLLAFIDPARSGEGDIPSLLKSLSMKKGRLFDSAQIIDPFSNRTWER